MADRWPSDWVVDYLTGSWIIWLGRGLSGRSLTIWLIVDYLAGRGLDGVSADGRDRNLKRSDLFVQKVEADLHDIGDVHRGGSGDRGESPVNGHEIGDGQDVRLLAVGDRGKALDVARVVIVADLHEVGLAVAACCHDDCVGPRHQCR